MFWENLHVVDLRHDTALKSVRSYVCHLKIKEMVHGWDILRNWLHTALVGDRYYWGPKFSTTMAF